MIRDLGRFAAAVVHHWTSLVTGGLLVAVIGVFEHRTGTNVPWSIYVGFIAAGILWACFQAWADSQRLLRESLNHSKDTQRQLSTKDHARMIQDTLGEYFMEAKELQRRRLVSSANWDLWWKDYQRWHSRTASFIERELSKAHRAAFENLPTHVIVNQGPIIFNAYHEEHKACLRELTIFLSNFQKLLEGSLRAA